MSPEFIEELSRILIGSANANGGWPYYPGKLSRIEPTCWAALALLSRAAEEVGVHLRYITQFQHPDGLLGDSPELPANLSWSALGFLTAASLPDTSTGSAFRHSLLGALVNTSGVQLNDSPVIRQNNKLKGWPWIPDTFSWVEPTSWGILALKTALRESATSANGAIATRVAEGEAVLIDRVCDAGGWNFGNATVFGKNLPPHIPTTVLGLIALQDKRQLPAVQRSLDFVEQHWRNELSGTALALSLICFRIYSRPTEELETALARQWQRTQFLGNIATTAMALCALDSNSGAMRALTLRS